VASDIYHIRDMHRVGHAPEIEEIEAPESHVDDEKFKVLVETL
jgi:hypothetical protein